jgi:hypothetical protein
MIFSRHVLFLHVPKTGGLSVSRYLLDTLPRPIFYARPAEDQTAVPDGVTVLEGIRHEPLAMAANVVEQHGYRLADFSSILATVRNPYEIEVSRYAFLQLPWHLTRAVRPPEWELAVNADFPTFACGSRPHSGRRIEEYFLCNAESPDNLKILRFERLEGDLVAALERVGIAASGQLPRLNTSEHADFASYYTAAAEEAVYAKYRWVFDQGFYPRLPVAGS